MEKQVDFDIVIVGCGVAGAAAALSAAEHAKQTGKKRAHCHTGADRLSPSGRKLPLDGSIPAHGEPGTDSRQLCRGYAVVLKLLFG